MNVSDEVDQNEGSSTKTTIHTVEKKEITISRGVYETVNSNFSDKAAVTFPPSSSRAHQTPQSSSVGLGLTSSAALKRSLGDQPQIDRGFKHYGHRMRLYCRNGFCLMISHDGSVHGDELGAHPGGILEFSSAGVSEVRIRAVDANLYLAMNKKGELYGEEDPRNYSTVFVEGTFGQYNTYLSQKYAHLGWYVGIKKNGTIKKGPLTKWGQKAIQFLPVRSN